MIARTLKLLAATGLVALVSGCAAPSASGNSGNFDYTAFRANMPRSVLVLPPLNESPDVGATYGLLSQVTLPLAEAGYYVLPVALVDETFRQNGLSVAADAHNVSPAKLRDIFGADAALYITISDYGAKYLVLDSVVVAEAGAKLVDLRSGQTLWTGHARASSSERTNNQGGGLIGMLVTAALTQVINQAADAGYQEAGIASARLLTPARPGGLLYGPRSPYYNPQ